MGPRDHQGGAVSTTSGTGIGTSETTVNQKVGMVFGAVYILVGIMGFFVGGGFAGQEGALLLGIFEVNILHSIVHLAIGVALIGAARAGDNAARTTNMAIGAVYLALG